MPFHRRQAGVLQGRSLPSFLLAMPSLCESAFSSLPFPPFTDARSTGSGRSGGSSQVRNLKQAHNLQEKDNTVKKEKNGVEPFFEP